MCYLKLRYQLNIVALVIVSLLAACDKATITEDSKEEVISHEVPAPTTTATPEVAVKQTGPVAKQPVEEAARSADSLKLNIMEDPYGETAPTGFGATAGSGWLENDGHAADLDEMPANANLLPDLFGETERDKRASIKMNVLIDDEEEISDSLDGAGVSIKYKTD